MDSTFRELMLLIKSMNKGKITSQEFINKKEPLKFGYMTQKWYI